MNTASALLSLIIVLVLAIAAFRTKLLSETGTIAAIVVGACLFILPIAPIEGWIWFLLLATFFISSSAVTRFKKHLKHEVNQDFAKGGVRDLAQVIANGAVAVFLAALYHAFPHPVVFVSFVAVVAVSNADTFATELGILSKSKPFLITTFKRVENGASGAISVLGTAAEAAGAFLIAVAALALLYASGETQSLAVNPLLFLAIVTFSGLLGAMADSFFGATTQAMYYCKACGKQTEKTPLHSCGQKTEFKRGIRWVDNDVVNLFSTIVGGLAAAGLWLFLT